MAVLCSNCSGKLIFNPASQKLECANCGSKFSPEDVQDFNTKLDSQFYDTRVYTCNHCGAEIITSDSEVSTFCVYCGNPAIVFSRIAKEYKPDGLIPFSVTKEEAIKYIKIRFKKNMTVPKEVISKLTPENLRGIYIPYWVVKAKFTEAAVLSGEVTHGKHVVKRYYHRVGEVKFKNVPVDGSKILNDDISSRHEPFYLEEAVEFDEDYLNGFYSNTSDITYDQLRESAAQRCNKLFDEKVINNVDARNVTVNDSMYWIDIMDNPVYIMMPVWFFTFKYEGKPYTILVNGQSGKVVGTMPWIKKRIVSIGVGVFAAVMAVLSLLFVAISFNFGGLGDIYNHIVAFLMIFATVVFIGSLVGLKRIKKNLKLTQASDIFHYVKKRQG